MDGLSDIVLTGGAGWLSIPVAFSKGDGSFRVTNTGVPNFPIYATQTPSQVVSGDFNGDGKVDLALAGGAGWGTVPVALSNGDGSFTVSNNSSAIFTLAAGEAGAKLLSEDFDGDGLADLAITGVSGWNFIATAVNPNDPPFGTMATQNGAKPVDVKGR